MRLTEQLVSHTIRPMEDSGPLPGVSYFTDDLYDDNLRAVLRERPSGPLLIFVYGSLIWKPAFTAVKSEPAKAIGWHRAFCLRVERFRGTRAQPGLMMQIDQGGICEGAVLQIDEQQHWQDLSALWRREMTALPPSNLPRWITVETAAGQRQAIAFTANPGSPNYRPGLSSDEVAQTLSIACGHWGSCADYLRQTVLALENAGIHDAYLWDLQERVAAEIEKRLAL